MTVGVKLVVNVAIIGCGQMGSEHLRGYRELKQKKFDNFTITAVCDVAKERANDFSDQIQSFQNKKPKIFLDYKKVIEIEDIDAVDICTDHRHHHIIGNFFLEAGKHVMVEKPMGITVKACRKMIQAAEKNGRVLAVAENYRRSLDNRAIKWVIENGYIGDVQMIFSGCVGGVAPFGRDAIVIGTPWRHVKVKTGAGPVLDNGIHDMDLFRYFNGEVEEAVGVTKTFEKVRVTRDKDGNIVDHVKNTVEDAGFAILKFENGAIGHWAPAYWSGHGETTGWGMWIYGSKGCIKEQNFIGDNGMRANVVNMFLLNASQELRERYFPQRLMNSVAIEIYDYLKAIETGSKPETDGGVGLKDEAVCYAVIESAWLNQPVKVKDVEEEKVEGYQEEINESLGL